MHDKDLNTLVSVYQAQLVKGDILLAYRALVKLVMRVRSDFIRRSAGQYHCAGIMHGYLDYTYFYYSSDALKRQQLKLGLVLNHVQMRFEIWLLGNTENVQQAYWQQLKSCKWNQERSKKPLYAILEAVIVEHPDFSELDTLCERIVRQAEQVSLEIIEVIGKLAD